MTASASYGPENAALEFSKRNGSIYDALDCICLVQVYQNTSYRRCWSILCTLTSLALRAINASIMSDFQEVTYDNSLEGDMTVPVQQTTDDDDELSTLDEPVRVTFVSFCIRDLVRICHCETPGRLSELNDLVS